MEIVSWLNLIMGVVLFIVGFIYTMLFGMIVTDRESSRLTLLLIFISGVTIMIIGVYSAMVGLGFDLL